MEKFKSLDNRSVSEVEKTILDSWGGINEILKRSIEVHENDENFVFYDGPAFANGFPGLHHMVAKNLKDSMCKYHVMKGKKVVRKIGWDTHGLPIENHVQKKIGIATKKDIEEFGIGNFNAECRKSVRINEDAFVDLTKKMGQFIDTEKPYVTMDNEYIETEWWILKKLYDEGYFYEGNKVMPYCPVCGTGLATHEVAQGYQDVSVDTVIVPMKLVKEDAYFLVWTTTPWTLLSNVGISVNPNEKYVKVLADGVKYIVAKALASSVLEEYEVLEEYTGKELEFTEYEQLLPFLKIEGKAFYVVCGDYVSMDSGTGIVHMSPAFGEDDFNTALKYDLPVINPVDADGTYKEGPYKGMKVFDADLEIIKYLKENNKLFKKQKIVHSYPHCWRCSSPLLYYAMPAYYVAVSKIKDKLVEANKSVNWYPSYVGEKRFENWLSNARDWNVSRSRYWGAPIPFWKCDCGHNHMVGSILELKSLATTELSEDFDLHKPFIDDVMIKCDKCGQDMKRIPDVLDCWFDSGSMPFAQYHYPFENQELFETQFPADFICEGIDQTRGWFYTLLVISTFVKGVAPFKNVLVNDLLLDAEGKKMSKSKGNIVEPFETIKEYGADSVRFYLPYVSPVWTPLKFDVTGLKEVHSKFFNPLKNTYNFFVLYANTDNIDIDNCFVEYNEREEIDKWLLSKYNRLLKYVTESYDEYDLNKVVRALTEFVSEDLSNWYIRRNRKRFWDSDMTSSKKSVYITTYEVLLGLSKMMAPVAPFLSEEIYRNLTGLESVHLDSFPKYDESLIIDETEESMDLVRDLISIGRMVREEAKIKVRQPLSEALLDGKNEAIISHLVPLIIEELNVKNVVFEKDLTKFMDISLVPNFKVCGSILGSRIKEFQELVKTLSNEVVTKLYGGETVTVADIEITPEMVSVKTSAKEGFNIGTENDKFIVLNTEITEELKLEGNAREVVSKVQQLRKSSGFEITDRIAMTYMCSVELDKTFEMFSDYIKSETLMTELTKVDNVVEETVLDINGLEMKVNIVVK